MDDERKVLGMTPKVIIFIATKGIPLVLQVTEYLGVKPSISCSSLLRGRYWDQFPISWGCPRPNVRCLFVDPQGN